ncbi:MAG: serpin family protein [Chitinispirillaceae bacterium]
MLKTNVVGSVLVVFAGSVLLSGCSDNGTGVKDYEDNVVAEQRSAKAYNSDPSASDDQIADLSRGVNQFGLDLFGVLGEQEQNVFFSPYSVASALTMVYGGTDGDVASELEQVLGISSLAPSWVHEVHNRVGLELQTRGEGAQGREGEGFSLNVDNTLWGEKTYQFREPFLDILSVNYDCGVRTVDFINQPVESKDLINSWVEDRTNGKIENLIKELSVYTRMVLTNTVYFDAAWQAKFSRDYTHEKMFKRSESDSVQVEFMREPTGSFAYSEGEDFKAVEMPYSGGEIAMTVILPKGDLDQFAVSLDETKLSSILSALELTQVELEIPRFSYTYGTKSFKEELEMLGLERFFSSELPGIGDKLKITDVLHQAFVAVDEDGTTAAAATAVIGEVTSMPPQHKKHFCADKPFIFLIRDIPTGTVLFMGKVVDPS